MALLWIEGFEGFGNTLGVAPAPAGILARKYPIVNRENFMDIETGRFGYCLEITETTGYIQTPNLTTDSTLIAGMAVKFATSPTVISRLFSFYDGSTDGVNIRVNLDGTIAAYRGTTLLGASTLQLTSNDWYFIELKVVTSNTIGTIDVVVNSTNWLSLSSQDTQPGTNAYHTAVRLGPPSGGLLTSYDDMYVLDSTGTANNVMLGNRRVDAIVPNAAGDDTTWTPSAGSNFQTVDDGALLDEDTSYNETAVDANDDLYVYSNLPGDASTVDGIMIVTETRVTTGSMNLSQNIKSGATEYPGTANTIVSSTYVTVTRLEEQDPDTSLAWTPAGVNAAQFGIRANT